VVRGRSSASRRVAELLDKWDIDMIGGFEFRSQARGPAPERQWVAQADHQRRGGTPRPAASTLLAALPNGTHRSSSGLTAKRVLPAAANGTARKFARRSVDCASHDGDPEEEISDESEDAFLAQVREALRDQPERLERFTQAFFNYCEGRSGALLLKFCHSPKLVNDNLVSASSQGGRDRADAKCRADACG
jgi:hypothetical protein